MDCACMRSPDKGGIMRKLLSTVILLILAAPAAAQTADRLYVMDCGHNSAKDQSRWSPGVNVAKPMEQSDTCALIKHGAQWLLWDTGSHDPPAAPPLYTPYTPPPPPTTHPAP